MDYYPESTVARYTTKLANVVELEGDWEVGLTDISVPSAVDNVVYGRCYYGVFMNYRLADRIALPPGNYKLTHTLIQAMNDEQRRKMPLQTDEPLFIEFSVGGGKIFMKILEQ